MSNFTGRKKSPHQCEFCDEVAVYEGRGLKDNFPRYYKFCAVHGPEARKDHFIISLEELPEYKSWKKQLNESQQRHPSAQSSLLNEA